MNRMNEITREELRLKLQRGDRFKLVLALAPLAQRNKRIPTSLAFETFDDALAALDRDDEIVVYCADVHCAASIYAYRRLESAGYAHVRRFAGGIAEWEEAGYTLEGAVAEPVGRRPSTRLPRGLGRAVAAALRADLAVATR